MPHKYRDGLPAFTIEDTDNLESPNLIPCTVTLPDGTQERRYALIWDGRDNAEVFTHRELTDIFHAFYMWSMWHALGDPDWMVDGLAKDKEDADAA